MASKKIKTKLEKIENLLNEAGYVLRFEKGNFNSGYCILEHRRVIIVNKFLDLEGRYNILSELLRLLSIDKNRLTPESTTFYQKVQSELEDNDILHQLEEQNIEFKRK